MTDKPPSRGLAGVVAGQTAIASVGPDDLTYRGYSIQELAEKTSFEEVAHLLIYGELPNRVKLAHFRDTLTEYRNLPLPVRDVLRTIPTDAGMMDVLRTTVSVAGHYDPTGKGSENDDRRRALWLMSTVASLISSRYRFTQRQALVEPKPGLSYVAQILHLCQGKEPDPHSVKLLDLILLLSAEHGFGASTFAARVVASTASDMVSAVVGAIGAMRGPREGGACREAVEMLRGLESPEEAGRYVREAIETKSRIPGFGHRIYRNGDPRARILETELRRVAAEKGWQKTIDIYDALKTPMVEERGLHPNLALPCGLTFHLLGLPADMFAPLLVAGRIVGWCAHFIEQSAQTEVYRPASGYAGEPPRPVPPMDQR